jgi:PII-like signaling protein
LYQVIVESARRTNLAGASVFPIDLSFGSQRIVHDLSSDYSAADVPVAVEIVDRPEKIREFVSTFHPLLGTALVTEKAVHVLHGWHAGDTALPGADGETA